MQGKWQLVLDVFPNNSEIFSFYK